MPQMTNAQARLVDPVLSAAAQGFSHNEFVGAALFPVVPVSQRGGQILTFGKEDFMLYQTGRTPGQNTKRVKFGYLGGPYVLEQHALEGMLPFETMEEALAVPGVDMGMSTVKKTQNIIALRLEKARADLARTAGNYGANTVTLAGGDQWSDFASGTSDPADDVETAIEAIRQKTGKKPNTMVAGAQVVAKLRRHPKILSFFSYSAGSGQVITPQMLAQYFSVVNFKSGESAYADDAGNFSDVWGKDVILAYTQVDTLASMGTPTFGYTYQLKNYPTVEEPYFDRNAKSWIYPVTDEVAPVIAGAYAGYLIKNAVA